MNYSHDELEKAICNVLEQGALVLSLIPLPEAVKAAALQCFMQPDQVSIDLQEIIREALQEFTDNGDLTYPGQCSMTVTRGRKTRSAAVETNIESNNLFNTLGLSAGMEDPMDIKVEMGRVHRGRREY